MRKFTTLFLLACAMTIGANQAFAQKAGAPNNTGKQDRTERDDNDNGDPLTSADRLTFLRPCLARPCFPPLHKPKLVKKEAEDCGCVHKVMRVNGRFMPFIDCYNTVQINGREQLRYCKK